MTSTEKILIENEHVEGLAECRTQIQKIRYAAEQLGPRCETDQVRTWLAAYGVDIRRPYVSTHLNGWRRERGLLDTGNMPPLTEDKLRELDAFRRELNAGEADEDDTPDTEVDQPAREQSTAASAGTADQAAGFRAALAEVPRSLTFASRFAWIAVLVVAFGISWWSLFEFARHFQMPTILAAGVSVVFDGAALIVANLSHRYAVTEDSGAGPRLVLLGVLGGSVYLNWAHAQQMGFGLEASIMFAAPAAVAIVLFELQTGWSSRKARRERGRVAPALPVLGRWSWIFHPAASIKSVWLISQAQGRSIRLAELDKHKR